MSAGRFVEALSGLIWTRVVGDGSVCRASLALLSRGLFRYHEEHLEGSMDGAFVV